MAENLKTTKYRNGDTIPNVADSIAWSSLATGAYCDIDNNPGNNAIYGKLYNFYTIADSRNVCPTGWHVPTDEEWTTLTNYLGGESVAGGKLKEAGTTHWISPNSGATNETGFTALPGSIRDTTGSFYPKNEYIHIYIGSYGFWWSSSNYNTNNAWIRYMCYDCRNVTVFWQNKICGSSVRCVKN